MGSASVTLVHAQASREDPYALTADGAGEENNFARGRAGQRGRATPKRKWGTRETAAQQGLPKVTQMQC